MLYLDNCLIEANKEVVKGEYTVAEGTRIIAIAAFSDNKNLTKIILPKLLIPINGFAFRNSRLTEISIPASVTVIGHYAYYGCGGLKEITIPGNVKTISHSAFEGCGNIEKVAFGDIVESICHYAFMSCSKLTEARLPSSVIYKGFLSFPPLPVF